MDMAHEIFKPTRWETFKSHLTFQNVLSGIMVMAFFASFPVAYNLLQQQMRSRSNAEVNTTLLTPTNASVPAAPVNIRIGTVQATSIEIFWDLQNGASSYTAGYKNTNDHIWNLTTNITDKKSYIFSNLKPNISYQFGVQACNSFGCSPLTSSQIIFTLSDNPSAK